jgi:hypothetical protein
MVILSYQTFHFDFQGVSFETEGKFFPFNFPYEKWIIWKINTIIFNFWFYNTVKIIWNGSQSIYIFSRRLQQIVKLFGITKCSVDFRYIWWLWIKWQENLTSTFRFTERVWFDWVEFYVGKDLIGGNSMKWFYIFYTYPILRMTNNWYKKLA